ncbi:MAG: SDR family NAD(P)-dependent oxidoreductase, partial [Chitinophagaceae bacterium]|nr:SDR family NAD(P)-dependent oxidoreductase [Chitinophagaceae bacterium]
MSDSITVSSFAGKVVLVTGSSRGIGAAIAKEFAQHGAKVVLHGRDEQAIQEVERTIAEAGGKVMITLCDLNNFVAIETMREQIEKNFGPVDILIANAGGSFTPPAPLEEIPEEGWRTTIDGNLTTTFLTLKSFLPGMKKRGSGT